MFKSWSQKSLPQAAAAATVEERPAHYANDSGTAFRNPWPSATSPTWTELYNGSMPLSWYDKSQLGRRKDIHDIKVVEPDWGVPVRRRAGFSDQECATGTWLGHAGVLVELPVFINLDRIPSSGRKSCWLLFDPIFSPGAGPVPGVGPQRLRASPCQVSDLPGCDAVFISHNHYDHLDFQTIKALKKRFPAARFFVPLGNKNWMVETGVPSNRVVELDWWQDREFSAADFVGGGSYEDGGSTINKSSSSSSSSPSLSLSTSSTSTSTTTIAPTTAKEQETSIRITCVPAQHNSGRTGLDTGKTLWSGWVAELFHQPTPPSSFSDHEPQTLQPQRIRLASIYHAGDTGYRRTTSSRETCPAFREIGNRFNGFDISFIPIWRGGSLGFLSTMGLKLNTSDIPTTHHITPSDAVDVHFDVKSKRTVAIHFGTFVGSTQESLESVVEFREACEKGKVGWLEGFEGKGDGGGGGGGGKGVADDSEEKNGRAGCIDIGSSIVVPLRKD